MNTKKLLDLPKVISISHTVEPSWASDAGRNSNSGKYNGTFVGYFDNLTINFGKTNQAEMSQIKRVIEMPIIENIEFVDSSTGENKIEDFFGGVIEAVTNNTKGIYDPFSISLQAVSRRSDL